MLHRVIHLHMHTHRLKHSSRSLQTVYKTCPLADNIFILPDRLAVYVIQIGLKGPYAKIFLHLWTCHVRHFTNVFFFFFSDIIILEK